MLSCWRILDTGSEEKISNRRDINKKRFSNGENENL